jgi:hypothetical protein
MTKVKRGDKSHEYNHTGEVAESKAANPRQEEPILLNTSAERGSPIKKRLITSDRAVTRGELRTEP